MNSRVRTIDKKNCLISWEEFRQLKNCSIYLIKPQLVLLSISFSLLVSVSEA